MVLAGVVVGWFGFLAGFAVGPWVMCSDDCTAAPLNGIFLSGPLGLAAGSALGAIAWRMHWRRCSYLLAVAGASLAVLGLGVILSWPEPLREAEVVRGEVVDCSSPSLLSAASIAGWRATIASEQWMTPRPHWESDVQRMLARSDGVVLTVRAQQRQDFYRRREPWRYGRLDATGWRRDGKTERFYARFAGSNCAHYGRVRPGDFVLDWEASTVSPPDVLPTFLGLSVIKPVHPKWRPPTTARATSS